MELREKLRILSDAAKYDAACTSSGVNKAGRHGAIGSAATCGICHAFAGDGRCISLLKVLLTNVCVYDCAYCVNRRSHDVPRAAFTPRELAQLTIDFYRRNYIEGLFLSSAVAGSPDATTERMIEMLRLLRNTYRFNGYVHAKAIPGTAPALIQALGLLADRLSVNIELPSARSLARLAPEKTKAAILAPMEQLRQGITENRHDLIHYRKAPRFAPAGQSTQIIIGASAESDRQILCLTSSLYRNFQLKRVFYSAYIPVASSPLLPDRQTPPPLWREHRLYQADWLLRFYGFNADELFDEAHPALSFFLDPKCCWALRHPEKFPLEVNCASYEALLRVPGIGIKSAWRILRARRAARLSWDTLSRLGVTLKRARYFLLCQGRRFPTLSNRNIMLYDLMSPRERAIYQQTSNNIRQTTLFPVTEPAAHLTERKELSCLFPPM